MKSVLKLSLLLVAFGLLQACTSPVPELTSPCVGAKGSPCDRRPVNQDLS